MRRSSSAGMNSRAMVVVDRGCAKAARHGLFPGPGLENQPAPVEGHQLIESRAALSIQPVLAGVGEAVAQLCLFPGIERRVAELQYVLVGQSLHVGIGDGAANSLDDRIFESSMAG